MERILHLRGTQVINGISVKVSKSGRVDSLHYCGEDTGPYYVGYNYVNSAADDGSYTFTFSKPVDEIMINLAAMSHSSSYGEEARIYINGAHYRFTKVGTNNSCGEDLCIITREGDISPCANCSGSGTNGIKIKGPITTLTIEAHIILGQPMGFVAGVWMAGKGEEETLKNYKAALSENAAGIGKELVIEGNLQNAEINLKDSNQNPVTIHYRSIEKNKILIDASELEPGEYMLEIKQNNQTEKQKLLVN